MPDYGARTCWLWATRGSALACLLLSSLEPLLYPEPAPPLFWQVAVFYPGLFLYLVVILRLRHGPDKFGLRLAVGLGVALLLIELNWLVAVTGINVRVVVFDGVWTLLHVVLVGAALKAYQSLAPRPALAVDPRVVRRWLQGVRAVTTALLLVAALPAILLRSPESYFLLPVALACGTTIWRLRHGPDRFGLDLAIFTGSVMGAGLTWAARRGLLDFFDDVMMNAEGRVTYALGVQPPSVWDFVWQGVTAGLLAIWMLGHLAQAGASWWLWRLQWPEAFAALPRSEQSAAFRYWFWVLRAGAAACLLLSTVFLQLLLLSPLCALILFRGERQLTLMATMIAGSVGALASMAPLILAPTRPLDLLPLQVAFLVLGVAALGTDSVRLTLARFQRRPGRLLRILVGSVCLSSAAVTAVYLATEAPPMAGEGSVISMLRQVNSGNASHEGTYGNGYAPTLGALEPPPDGTVFSCHASGFMRRIEPSNARLYRFEYSSGPPVARVGAGCTAPGAKSYTFVARPLRYGETGRRSFYTDESGVIRATRENRPATAQDPPVR